MNPYLAEMYGTAAAGEAARNDTLTEGQLKMAQLELFAKVAADNGIDLNKLQPAQVNALYSEVMKTAGEIPPQFLENVEKKKEEGKEKKDGEEEKKEEEKAAAALQQAALQEFQEKRAQQAKLAEAELAGQVMAHAFARELREIEQGQQKQASEAPTSGKAPLSVGGQKEASAFDILAAQNAVKMASDAGYDAGQVEQRLSALFTLEKVTDSTKIASIEDPATALQVRSLELLEDVGLAVDWTAV